MRLEHGVQVRHNGADEPFDKVVFAVPPGQVLRLVGDPTPYEQSRFGAWKDNVATTFIHSDAAIYRPYGISSASPFDFFEVPTGWGYNAYLNDLCGVASGKPYYLSYNIESIVDKASIVHRQQHLTPFYTKAAFKYREEIIATNGENHTFHAGAYLGDGLHEGAILAAKRVVGLVGSKMVK